VAAARSSAFDLYRKLVHSIAISSALGQVLGDSANREAAGLDCALASLRARLPDG
jgi:hypothetical protein